MSENAARQIVAAQQAVLQAMRHLDLEARLVLLEGVLCQEICTLPPADRDDELARVIRDLPGVLDITEAAMRETLARNARDD